MKKNQWCQGNRNFRYFSTLRWRLIGGMSLLFFILGILGGLIIYYYSIDMVITQLGERAKDIAITASLMIDAEKHKQLKSPQDESSSTYKEIQKELQKIVNSNKDIDSIYTLVRSNRKYIWRFVIDTYESTDLNNNGQIEPDEEKAHLGEEYDISNYPEMQKAFSGPQADKRVTRDKWGEWISGYAPIYDKSGQAIAIVGVDLSAQKVLSTYKTDIIRRILLVDFLAVLAIGIIIYFITIYINKPVRIICQYISRFNQGDWQTRIKTSGFSQEFKEIAESFNRMAEKIGRSQEELKKKLKLQSIKLNLKNREVIKSNKKLLASQKALVNLLEDLNETKNQIEESKNKYESILENIGEAVLSLDLEGRIINLNLVAEAMIGSESKKILHKKINQIVQFTDEDGQEINPFEKSLKEAKPLKYHNLYLINQKKEQIPVSLTASLLKDINKTTIGTVGVIRDISYEKSLDEMKDEFLSITSHELRAPMTAIKGYLSMVLEGDFGEIPNSIKDILKEVYKSNERLIKLVEDVLNISRIEQGRLEYNIEAVNLAQSIQELKETLGAKAQNKRLYLKINPVDPHLYVLADHDKLQQVLINLVDNAIKFTQKGGVEIKTKITKTKPPMVLIEVIDTGIGIAHKEQKLLFQKFQQLGKVLTRQSGGTGLGLYICKQLVEKMGGKIWLEKSTLGKGSVFAFTIPLFKYGPKK